MRRASRGRAGRGKSIRPLSTVALVLLLGSLGCGGSERGADEPLEDASADALARGEEVASATTEGREPVAVSPTGGEVSGATDFASLEALWSAQRYAEVLPLLKEHRRSTPYGKNEVVDYMIATSACRVPGEEDLGRRMLLWLLSHYSLNPESRAMVLEEQRRCPPSTRMIPVSISLVGVGPASTSGTRGKMFYMVSRGEDVPMANEPVVVHRAIPSEELEARRFPPVRAPEAVHRVRELAGEDYRVEAHGPFVFASRHHDTRQLARLGTGLGAYLDFYAAEYGMPKPPHLVTVYLAADPGEMREIAERVHGIGVSSNSIGYSFRDDLSMVGIIPGEIYGTLAHELFHLMVRREFGDVPPWLDEGMAALYEVSRVGADGRIRGVPNWRGDVLREFWHARPTLSDLVRADWQAFEAQVDEPDPVRQAANHATARYFVLYLQEQALLAEVYRAFEERDALIAAGDPGIAAVDLLERVTGTPVESLDASFEAWFGGL